jgi:hypothetical protein
MYIPTHPKPKTPKILFVLMEQTTGLQLHLHYIQPLLLVFTLLRQTEAHLANQLGQGNTLQEMRAAQLFIKTVFYQELLQ